MTRRRWLLAVAAAGIALFGLSFVNAWIVHDRELSGEGYRFVQHYLSAWRGVGMPVLSIGALLAFATAAYALVAAQRPHAPVWPLLVGAALVLGILIATAWPVAQAGHASQVRLSAGFLLPVGAVLAAVTAIGAIAVSRPPTRVIGLLAILVAVMAVMGAAARWWGLQLAEGDGRHWSEGSYSRPAAGGRPAQTLTIGDGTFRVDDRWSGTWEWSGWTVSLDEDPACPGARGTYHAHGEENDALRFVMVVDPCLDGERAADFESGIWVRMP